MRFFVVICFLLMVIVVDAQRSPDMNYMKSIAGVKLCLYGNQVSYPIIQLGSPRALQLDFDDIDNNIKNFYYTFELCNADWTSTDLNEMDYLQGFTQIRLTQYSVSSVAKTRYIHYEAILPDHDCVPTRSGNYLLKVFLNGDTSKLAFTRRVLVVSNSTIPVSVQIEHPFNNDVINTHQKVQISLDRSKLKIDNQQLQLKVVVLQNYKWDDAVTNIQPVFMRGNLYEYNGEQDCLFPAGNEYRWIDIRSFRYLSERIDRADENETPTDIFLHNDGERNRGRFITYADYNGFFYIESRDASNSWWQGDYANVHFVYVPNGNQPYDGKNVYIEGEMTNNILNDSTKMVFNAAQGVYEKTLLLKQGYYNYRYVTKDSTNINSKPDVSATEGNFWETENNYTVLVYYRSWQDRSDELVAAVTLNSLKSGSLY
jgi:hypothetical protein